MSPTINKADQAYDRILSMITFQELRPGSMVSEGMLMDATGFGRTPVREALQRLARERMVEIHPRRGNIIPPISVEVQLKLLELRRAVEELAVRMAARRASPEQQRTMLALADQLGGPDCANDLHAYGHSLRLVHECIVTAAQNEYLRLAMAPLQGLSRRFWFANLANIKNRETEMRKAASYHAAALRAIARSDESAASAAALALNDYLTEYAYQTLRRIDDRPKHKESLAASG
ncbi:GntR family transcriptional regulator [Indioceanicola profundi]|uniref:GntR family transcriptional regulator n=1 Tax=Indioceanicola profundi TaxID=2220096 RepID=UPI000E6AC0FE|nr:GntR family transcriptional regulator [Indioceanicola profundi]